MTDTVPTVTLCTVRYSTRANTLEQYATHLGTIAEAHA